MTLVEKKKWTLSEWLSAFLEAELAGWDDYEPDDYDDAGVVGDDYYGDGYHGDEIDSDILESLIILALSGGPSFLVILSRSKATTAGRREKTTTRPAATTTSQWSRKCESAGCARATAGQRVIPQPK